MSYAKYRALIQLPYPNAAGSDASATQAAAPLSQPPSGGVAADLPDYIHEIFVGHSKLHEEFVRGFDPVQFYTDIIEMPLMLQKRA